MSCGPFLPLHRRASARAFAALGSALLAVLPISLPAQPGPILRTFDGIDGITRDDATRLPAAPRRELRLFRTALEHLDAGRPAEAIVYLQTVLDAEADGFTEEAGRLVSLRAEAARRLDRLTGEAKQAYDLRYGPAAQGLLDEALKTGDEEQLAAVARRFGATDAGRDAALRLAAAHLDRGEPLAAVARLERLRDAGPPERRPALLLRLALCYERLGNPARRDAALSDLAALGGDLRVGDRTLAASDTDALRKRLADLTRDAAPTAADWPLSAGDPGRTNHRLVADGPERNWSAVSLTDPFLKPDATDAPATARLHRWAAQTALVELANGPVAAPSARPVLAGETVFLRTPANVTAFDLATGAVRWRTLADPLAWDYMNGAAPETPNGDAACRTILGQRLWSDATWGTPAADGRVVFAVEETGVSTPLPPPPGSEGRDAAPQPILPPAFNRLVAYDAATGGRVWEAGGPPDAKSPLAGAFFLGPPVPAGGRWYALADLGGATHLVSLDPNRPDEILWTQPVAEHDRPIDQDLARRAAGLAPTVAGGLLVCPVGPGIAVAVDPATRSLLWAYAEKAKENAPPAPVPIPLPIQRPADVAVTQSPPEIVTAGSLLLIASRPGTLAALDPLDGAPRWTASLPGHLWVVGADATNAYAQLPTGVTALRLADGTPAWPAPAAIGPPSGRGVIVAGRVYVPLADSTLAVLDAATGTTISALPVPRDEPLGNLVPAGRSLLSQSATRLDALPLP